MQISKKSLIIGLSSLAIVGSGIAYYFISRDNTDILGWTDSSWLYRKSVTVSNSGDALTNEDVLVEVDTATLVTAGKLQSDCDDLRFVDSDDSTYLSYWIEGGCNTSTTQVWIQIPSLPNGGKTIYMYYGNTSAVNAEASWSGNFILLSSSSCPSGWTRSTTFDDKYTYGASTYGTSFDGNHNHGQASGTTGYSIGGSPYDSANDDSPDGSGFRVNHTHTNAKVDVNNTIIEPPYVGLYFCTSDSLTHFPDSLGIFNTSSTTLPSGYSYYSSLEGKYPRGSSSFVASGGSSTHTHTTTGGYLTDATSSFATDDYNASGTTCNTHTHTTLDGTTGSGDNNVPYYEVVYGQTSSTKIASEGIIEMATVLPPLGWTRFTSLDSKFPKGAATAGGSYTGATHTHSITINTGTASASKANVWTTTGNVYVHTTHTHSATVTSSAVQALPAYVTTIFAQRKSSVSITFGEEGTQNTAPYAPSYIQIEGLDNTPTISDFTPEFTAIFSDADGDDTGNYYQIEVNTSSDFTGTIMWDSTKTAAMPAISNGGRSPEISYAGDTLISGNTYYWRIKFWDSNTYNSESDWSTTAQFTINAVPTAPTSLYLQGTSNPIKVLTAAPTFSAIFHDPDTIDTGTYYQIQVNTASDFSGTSMWDSNKTSITTIINETRSSNITYNGTSLTEGETYYWKIKFWDNNDNEGEWSSINQFIMQGIPDIPIELKTNNATNPTQLTSVPPTFSAIYADPNGDSASAYQINVNSNSSFTGTSLWDSGKVTTTILDEHRSSEYQYNGTELNNSHNIYYWRIKFWDSDDTPSDWSATAQFTDTFSSFRFGGIGLEGLKLD